MGDVIKTRPCLFTVYSRDAQYWVFANLQFDDISKFIWADTDVDI